MCRNLSRLQIRGILSKKIRFPLLGDFGRIKPAGTPCSSCLQEKYAAPMEHKSAAVSESRAI
ncbi:hypothetical protein, partial [Bacteroides congonensis]|uniref:hypothetical protein n=1 Tax=Bacteroides congonensis TaxID=1871006 RepID=UPI00321AB82B